MSRTSGNVQGADRSSVATGDVVDSPVPPSLVGRRSDRPSTRAGARHSTCVVRWILPVAAASVVGFAGGKQISSRTSAPVAAAELDEVTIAWKVRDATRTRLELRLRERIARRAADDARAEAQALVQLDPFHAEARAFLRSAATHEPSRSPREEGPAAASRESASPQGEAKAAGAYEEARREVRRGVFAAIDSMYPDPAVAAAVRRYAWEGRIDPATEDLRKLQRTKGDAGEDVEALIGRLRQVATKLEAGRLAWVDGRLAEADPLWRDAFAAERALLPEGVTSVPVREARHHLAQAWHREGLRLESRDQLAAAVAAWKKGIAADPADLDLRTALQRAVERTR